MSPSGQRFARIALDVFAQAGLGTDAEIKEAGGPSNSTLTLYRKVRDGVAELPEPRSPIFNALDSIAGWERGTARAVWKGADPPPVKVRNPSAPASATGTISFGGSGTLAAGSDAVALLAQRVAVLEQRVSELEADAYRGRPPSRRQVFDATRTSGDRDDDYPSALGENYAPAAKHGVIEESGEFNT